MQPKPHAVTLEDSSNNYIQRPQRPDCPADREELGKATWTFLHTMAAYYPEHPSGRQRKEMNQFMKTFSQLYPCDDCADHMQAR